MTVTQHKNNRHGVWRNNRAFCHKVPEHLHRNCQKKKSSWTSSTKPIPPLFKPIAGYKQHWHTGQRRQSLGLKILNVLQ